MSVWNGLPFLQEALEGLQRQTFEDFEIIAVDDGSTDASPSILRDFARRDRRISVIVNETNMGVAPSRNRGIQQSRGEFIACHDADDVSKPLRLESQVLYLDRHPKVGMLGTWPEFIDENGAVVEPGNAMLLSEDEELQAKLLDVNCFCAGSVMIRRRCLEGVGRYDQSLAPSEDYDMWLRLAEVAAIANLPLKLYRYRLHNQSASRVHRHVQMRHKAIALERALERRYGGDVPLELRELVARDFVRASFLAFRARETDQARTCVERAVDVAPWFLGSGAVVEEVVTRYLVIDRGTDPLQQVEAYFGEILPRTRYLDRVRRRICARLHWDEGIAALGRGEHEEWLRHLLAAVLKGPRLLLGA